jgi:hypothetical protein
MKPSEIRQELLGQHAEIHRRLEAARYAEPTDLHGALVRLADCLRVHNLREEELMTDIFPQLDAWGMIRAEVMVGEHLEEHRELWEAVLDTSETTDPLVAASKTRELCERIHEHMLREEKVFLNDEVLSDDVQVDYFGG